MDMGTLPLRGGGTPNHQLIENEQSEYENFIAWVELLVNEKERQEGLNGSHHGHEHLSDEE